jgi:hypothetical protein
MSHENSQNFEAQSWICEVQGYRCLVRIISYGVHAMKSPMLMVVRVVWKLVSSGEVSRSNDPTTASLAQRIPFQALSIGTSLPLVTPNGEPALSSKAIYSQHCSTLRDCDVCS